MDRILATEQRKKKRLLEYLHGGRVNVCLKEKSLPYIASERYS